MALIDSFRGDFLGFEFNGKHSSDFNIVIISGGDRLNKTLLPPQQDFTVDVPGRSGLYYFNSNYQQTRFDLKIGYDNLLEHDIRDIRRWLGDMEVHNLIFDEEPYKVYSCKIDGQPNLQFICFDNNDKTQRIYKGEGDIQFQAFYPFARARYKSLDEYNITLFPNKNEWKFAAKLLQSRTNYDTFAGNVINLYNPGDIASPLIIPKFTSMVTSGLVSITYKVNNTITKRMILDLSKLTQGNHYRLDSEKQLILGLDNVGGTFKPNNKVYNYCIEAGDFFKIESNPGYFVGETLIVPTGHVLEFSMASNAITIDPIIGKSIDYDYLYF